MENNQGQSRWVIWALACTFTLTGMAWADPGELFPNVTTYDETVSSPISKPEVKKTTPAPAPAPAPAPETPKVDPTPQPTPTPDPVKPPEQVDNNGNPINPKKPARWKNPPRTPPASQPAGPPPPPPVEYLPYSATIMKPIIGADDAKVFEEGFSEPITKALAATPEQRKKTADLLESAATGISSPELKRYLLLHAFGLYIRAAISSTEREQKAQALLPLLTDPTLPVMQARADALNDLSLTFSSNPSNAFLDLYLDAHAKLTKYRVQAGFPKEALDSLKKAREAGMHYLKKPQTRTDELNEAAAWCDRANLAVAQAPKYQAALKANPNDPATNTIMATLHLSLYGNLEHAMDFAAKSDRKDMKQLATVLKDNPPDALSTDPAKHAEQVLAIGQALLDVAKATSTTQVFDRYSIACLAGDHVAQVVEDGAMPPSKMMEAKTMLASAKDLIDKTFLKRGDDLPKWLGGTGGPGGTAGAPAAVAKKTIGAAEDFFRGMPKELAPSDIGWTPSQMQKANDWMTKNIAGQTLDAQIFIENMESPRDGPGGKIYVPIMFLFQNFQLNNTIVVRTTVELRATPEMAKKAKDLGYEQQLEVKGSIQSVKLREYSSFPGEPKIAEVIVVVSPPN